MRKNYRYQRKRLLPLRDAVLLHLEPFSSHTNPYDMPEATCQEVMSTLLSASRGNLSRVMKQLRNEGYLDEIRAHVPIGKLRRKTYVLTEVGMKEARSLRWRTGNRKIQLKDVNGELLEVKLGDIPRELRDGSSLLDVALSVHRGVFDMQSYYEKIRKRSPFVCIEEQRPRVKEFFGRKRELNDIEEWFESKKERVLEVRGVAGIGKTALVATAFKKLKERTNAIWLGVNEQSTARSVLEDVACLLNLLGKRRLSAYLKSHEKVKLEEVYYILSTECRSKSILFVVDGCEKIQGNLADFIKLGMKKIEDNDWVKIVFVGRKMPRLYNATALKKSGLLRKVILRKLDYENSKKILQLKGVESWKWEEAYAQTGGLPLLLELVDPVHAFKKTDAERYLVEEVLSELDWNEMRLLKIMSIFNAPVHSDAFFQWRGMKNSTIKSLVEKSLLLEVSPMVYDTHDMLRDFAKKRLSTRTKKEYHRKAAEYYLGLGDIRSIVQSLFHLIDAGRIGEAVNLLTKEGRQIIAAGYSEDLYRFLLVVETKRLPHEVPELAFLKGECLAIHGSWDEAIEEYDHYRQLSEGRRDLSGVSVSLRRVAEIQRKRGQHKEALNSLQESARISEKINDYEGLADCYYNIAALLLTKGDLQGAEPYVDKCLETAEISGNLVEVAKAHKVLGALQTKMGKNKESLRTKRKAVEYAKNSGDMHLVSECYNNLAVSYYELGKNEEALKSFERAAEFSKRIGDARAIA
ncbi:MAG: tetratricopeptide repeat protein, partial [Thermoplasmata archaeon]